MNEDVPSWQRGLAWVGLAGAILLFLWPILRGAEIYWPLYAGALPILALFALALVPMLLPTRFLRAEVVPLLASLSRVAVFVMGLLAIWEFVMIVANRGL